MGLCDFGCVLHRGNCFVYLNSKRLIQRREKMSNKVYDILKYVAQIVIPAVATLYFALSQIWGLPYGEQIVGTLAAVDAFLGALLGISTAIYNKGK